MINAILIEHRCFKSQWKRLALNFKKLLKVLSVFLSSNWASMCWHVISTSLSVINIDLHLLKKDLQTQTDESGRTHTLAHSFPTSCFSVVLTRTFIVLTLRFLPLRTGKKKFHHGLISARCWRFRLGGRRSFPHVSPPPPGTNGQDRSGH